MSRSPESRQPLFPLFLFQRNMKFFLILLALFILVFACVQLQKKGYFDQPEKTPQPMQREPECEQPAPTAGESPSDALPPPVLPAETPDVRPLSFSRNQVKAIYQAELEFEPGNSYRLRTATAEWDAGLRILPRPGEPGIDLSGAQWFCMDIENLSPDRQMRLTLHLSSGEHTSDSGDHASAILTKNRAVNTGIALNPGEKQTLRIFLPHADLYLSPEDPRASHDARTRNRGTPSIYVIDTKHISQIELKMQWPFEDSVKWLADVRISNLRLEGKPDENRIVPKQGFFPFIDEFGQNIHAEWPEKLKSGDELPDDLIRERAALRPAPASWDRFGGWAKGPKLNATGSFRTEKYDGKWFLVTPDGHLFFSSGIDVVRNNTDTPNGALHPNWYKSPIPADGMLPFTHWALQKKFGKDDYLADYYPFVIRRLDSWGINTIGNWGAREIMLLGQKPYTACVFERNRDVPMLPDRVFYDCYAPDFRERFFQAVKKAFEKEACLAKSVDDPMCIGYFVDNELGFKNVTAKMIGADFETCGSKREFLSRAFKKYKTVEALNAAWDLKIADWNELKSMTSVPKGRGFREDAIAFESVLYDIYFRTVREALRSVAPNRLYLGCRFVGFRQPGHLWDAAAKYCDVLSVNTYANSVFNIPASIWKGQRPERPILVGEFHFGTFDRGMFRASLCPVSSQTERARSYTRFMQGALCHPMLVGAHWFQYRDQPLVGRGDGEAYQIGFVDGCDRPYEELCNAARAVGSGMYSYRLRGKPINEMGDDSLPQ